MPEEPTEDGIIFQRTWRSYEELSHDARRKAQLRYWNMTERPDTSLRQNKEFGELQAIPWKLNLAIEMAWFARSDDLSSDIWPYKRFQDRLVAKGTPLPFGISIARAVAIVSSDLERLTLPKTPRAKAWEDGTWYERNISRPMARRIGATSLGAPSLSVDDTGQDSEINGAAEDSTGALGSFPQIDWLTGRTRDLDLETMTVPHLDVGRAPQVLDDLLASARRQVQVYRNAAPADVSGEERLDRAIQLLESHELALAIAAQFAKNVAAEVLTMEEFRGWLMRIDSTRDVGAETPSASDFWSSSPFAQVAIDSRATDPTSPSFVHIVAAAAIQYGFALGLRPSMSP